MSKHIPRHFINELIERCDIYEAINARISLKKRGINYIACCPFHNEKSPSFTVSPDKKIYHCFGCGVSGNIISFLMAYEHLEFPEAIETLASQCGLAIPYEDEHNRPTNAYTGTAATTENHRVDLYGLLERAKRYYHRQLFAPENKHALAYIQQRGISMDTIKRFSLGYAPAGWDNLTRHVANQTTLVDQLIQTGMLIKKDTGGCYDRFRNRVMFPILDRRGRTIGFGGRTLTDEIPKYLNSPETELYHKGKELYGLYHARQSPGQLSSLIIVEGYMDALALAQAGITNVVATLGTAITIEHLTLLLRQVHEVVFCFDGDTAGKKAAWRALEIFLPLANDGVQARFIFLPDGDDPDTLIQKEGLAGFKTRLANAVTFSDFFFHHLSEQVDLTTLDGKANLKQLAIPLLNKMPSGILLSMMQQRLASILRVDISQLASFFSKSSAQQNNIFVSKKGVNKPGTISPMRLIIGLLVQQPQLAFAIPPQVQFNDIELPGQKLLLKLIEIINNEPTITTAGIIEYFRTSPDSDIINKLATWDYLMPITDLHAELQATIQKLLAMQREQKVEYLLGKACQTALSLEEKQLLQHLISEKHAQG